MRTIASSVAIAVLAFDLASCQLLLGIDPDGRKDAPVDASLDSPSDAASDASSASDANAQSDGDSSAPEDACLGHSDCPPQIEPASLQLWLRGFVGVDCGSGRVATWRDQSGHGNDATAATYIFPNLSRALTPRCGVDRLAEHGVVTFSAPTELDAGDGGGETDYVDETLALDMNWIVETDYTVFVVHRPAVDSPFGLLAQDRSEGSDACRIAGSEQRPQEAFALDYQSLDDGGTGVGFHQYCGGLNGDHGVSDIDTFAPNAARVDEIVFSQSTGHRVYTNGHLVVNGIASFNDTLPIEANSATDAGLPGVIGRSADAIDVDTRYHGDIAEIIGYSTALSDDERAQIEGYLKRQWGLTF